MADVQASSLLCGVIAHLSRRGLSRTPGEGPKERREGAKAASRSASFRCSHRRFGKLL